MAGEYVEKPVPGPEAFMSFDHAAVHSQAAILLALGAQLRGDVAALEAVGKATDQPVSPLDPEDLEEFPVPRLAPSRFEMDISSLEAELKRRYGVEIGTSVIRDEPNAVARIADDVFRKKDGEMARMLILASLEHPIPLVGVSAAAAALAVLPPHKRPLSILETGSDDDDPLVSRIATVALARFDPYQKAVVRQMEPTGNEGGGVEAHTSILVHGTFARGAHWWRPGGSFHQYLRTHVRNDLYGGKDRFDWSGGWSDGARAVAAWDLVYWINARSIQNPDIFAHSHGANVAMLAGWGAGFSTGKLVALSCPVHPQKYMPNFRTTNEVISVRVRMDLVILIDGGGQRFRYPTIRENILPIWFNHSATHDENVWRKYDVPAMI